MIATTVSTKFIAVDQFSPVVKKMEGNLAGLTDRANTSLARQERLFRRLTPALGHATKQLLSYASAGAVLGGLAFSGKAIMDYETSIQSLSAVTGVSGSTLATFKDEIKSVADQSKKSATEVAGSFEVIGSMMSQYLTDPKALRQISEAGITLSKASRQELVPTLENLTSIMNQFDLKANQATDTINRLTAGEIVGSLRTSQVAEALQEFGAGASAANITLSESVALTEALAKQLKTDKIGVGARNILTVLDSAKGLDKKARKDLRKSGVDLGFLMDKSKTLSERLHELSKISGNATTVTSVFGKENKTAAQVIFNQLGTYDEYLAKIKVTNEAQSQSVTNSNALSVAVEELKNTWINYIATSDKANAGLEKLKSGAKFLATNMDTIVSVGVNVIKFMALWKTALIAQRIVVTGLSIATGIQSAVLGASSLSMKGNTVALATQTIAMKTAQIATMVLTGDFAAMNAVLLANPIGLIVVGLAALAGATYYAYQKTKELREEYQKSIALKHEDVIKSESIAVQKLADHYRYLGFSIKEANALAIRTEKVNIDTKRKALAGQITTLKEKVAGAKVNSPMNMFAAMYDATISNGADAQKLNELQSQDATLATRGRANTEMAKGYMDAGLINKGDLGNTFGTKKSLTTNREDFGDLNYLGSKKQTPQGEDLLKVNYSETDRILMEAAKALKEIAGKMGNSQSVDVNISGLPSGASAKTSANKINTGTSY